MRISQEICSVFCANWHSRILKLISLHPLWILIASLRFEVWKKWLGTVKLMFYKWRICFTRAWKLQDCVAVRNRQNCYGCGQYMINYIQYIICLKYHPHNKFSHFPKSIKAFDFDHSYKLLHISSTSNATKQAALFLYSRWILGSCSLLFSPYLDIKQ